MCADRTKTYSDDANIILDVPSLDVEVPDATLVTINGDPIMPAGPTKIARATFTSDGSLSSGVGVSANAEHVSTGLYVITFDLGFFNGPPVVQIQPQSEGGLHHISIDSVNSTTVELETLNSVQDLADCAFSLIAISVPTG